MSKYQVASWIAGGYLHPVLPTVYAVGHTAPSHAADLTAALLHAGPGAALSHATALCWWGVTIDEPRVIHVSTPRRCRSRAGIAVHGRREIESVWHEGLRVATPAQALLDHAARATLSDLRYALAQTEYRELLDLGEVNETAGRGKSGSARLRKAISRHEPKLALTRSRLERAFIEMCESQGLPLPEFNVKIDAMTVDAVYHDARLVVELDGGGGHGTIAQMKRDRVREMRLRQLGYAVVRYTYDQVTMQPGLVAQDIRRLLAAAA